VRCANTLTFGIQAPFRKIGAERKFCGDDVQNFEPTVARRSFSEGRQTWLKFKDLDKIVRDLRRIYKENPGLFNIPTFSQKQY
jgi:hypothetical protein